MYACIEHSNYNVKGTHQNYLILKIMLRCFKAVDNKYVLLNIDLQMLQDSLC